MNDFLQQPMDPGRRRAVAALLLWSGMLASYTERAHAQSTVDLLVETDGDLLEYRQKELSCPTGAHVRLTFRHTGRYVSFEHNWVLIVPHSFDEVVAEAAQAGEANGWLPRAEPRILAATPLCGRGHEVSVEFTAPAPGDYPYICTFPGHAASMWGVLHVTKA
jgi:azurin